MSYSDMMLDWSPGEDNPKGQNTAPPEHKDLTFGTQDLAWLVPAIVAALSGHGGQQFAGGLLQGAVKGKINRNMQENKRLLDIWKAQQPRKKGDEEANMTPDYGDLDASVGSDEDLGGGGAPSPASPTTPAHGGVVPMGGSHPAVLDAASEAMMALSAIKRDPMHAKFYATLFSLRTGNGQPAPAAGAGAGPARPRGPFGGEYL